MKTCVLAVTRYKLFIKWLRASASFSQRGSSTVIISYELRPPYWLVNGFVKKSLNSVGVLSSFFNRPQSIEGGKYIYVYPEYTSAFSGRGPRPEKADVYIYINIH